MSATYDAIEILVNKDWIITSKVDKIIQHELHVVNKVVKMSEQVIPINYVSTQPKVSVREINEVLSIKKIILSTIHVNWVIWKMDHTDR